MKNKEILKENISDLLLSQDNEKIVYISSSANNLQYYYSKLKDCNLEDLKYLSLNSYNENELMGININILESLKSKKKSIILIDIYLALRVFFDKVNLFSFQKDKEYKREEIKSFLLNNGYKEEYMVEKKAEFSIRGDVIDIFPSNLDMPIRLDFFDDYLEKIKVFSCYNQRSLSEHEKIDIYSNVLYGNEKEMIDLIANKDCKIYCENVELLEIKLEQILSFYSDINLKDRFDKLIKESTLLQVIKSKDRNYQLEIKSKKEHIDKKGKKYDKADQIKIGDYVIHVEFGIGIYQGIVNINEREYLMLQYADHDKLYIPVEKLDRISKYVSNTAPKLYSLGTKGFKRKEKKLREDLEKFAQELISIQAKRKLKYREKYNKDSLWQQEFEEEFEFELTEDQIISLNEVKKDLESNTLMDRLIIGDVGYGKTEIAIRAAFKTIENGYQCAILAPTTVLANQHYERIHKRFEKYAIKVASFSRLSSDSKVLNAINNGEIDLIIGTHKLLSDKVKFKKLGLLIIDEEQKFGVSHKEKIKKKQFETNLLTLSATPIPRTLNLALLGIKDISIINTAPINRLPIVTEIIEENQIKNVILKELTRDGQVFYITNNVKLMEDKKEELKKLLPEFVKIEYIHGQLKANEIKEKINDFNEGKFDVLIASTIIENGIDISNANTIIIEKYTHLGLSQIYQLRGRVGRGQKQGYCYLLKESYSTKKGKEKQKSLEKIEGIQGAGYFLSLEDLNIRGAGEILGEKQHGAIDTFGYDLYLKMLENEMKKIKGEKIYDFKDVELKLLDFGYIPNEFIQKEERILIYKRYSQLTDFNSLKDLNNEIRDRFGKIPDKMQKFINSIMIKIYLIRNEFEKIVESNDSYFLYKEEKEFKINKQEFENDLKTMIY